MVDVLLGGVFLLVVGDFFVFVFFYFCLGSNDL